MEDYNKGSKECFEMQNESEKNQKHQSALFIKEEPENDEENVFLQNNSHHLRLFLIHIPIHNFLTVSQHKTDHAGTKMFSGVDVIFLS